MMLVVLRTSEEPVYEQIARQIRERVARGDMPPGTRLPTVRSLGSDLGVNLNTVARAYRVLEDEGFVRIRDRSGAETLAPASKRSADREHLLQDLRRLLACMRQAGFQAAEMRLLVARETAPFTDDTE